MNFLHRTVYQLAGIHEVPVDPWRSLAAVPFGELAAEYDSWLATLSITEVKLSATVTVHEDCLAELDAKTALANRILDGPRRRGDSRTPSSESVADIRLKRATDRGHSAWLIFDATGEHSVPALTWPDLDEDLGASFEQIEGPSTMSALGGPSMQELHDRIIGAVCLAARENIQTRLVDRGWWYIRPDGRPHYQMALSMSARGFVSTALPSDAISDLPRLLVAAQQDPRVARAIAVFGQSLRRDLDPNLEFLSAFTALELLAKSRTRARAYSASNKRSGLAKNFETLAAGDATDCATFDQLYAQRNGLAHEARFNIFAADQARRLFKKYMTEVFLP